MNPEALLALSPIPVIFDYDSGEKGGVQVLLASPEPQTRLNILQCVASTPTNSCQAEISNSTMALLGVLVFKEASGTKLRVHSWPGSHAVPGPEPRFLHAKHELRPTKPSGRKVQC